MCFRFLIVFFSALLINTVNAQNGYWQQHVKYRMDIDMEVNTNRFTGKQILEYTNNSTDTLHRVFYQLYWNAFQPGSMMDERSRRQGQIEIGKEEDWDPRVKDRIANLKQDEIGYQKIGSLKMNGVPQKFVIQETVMLVTLSKPILPKQKAIFDMDFETQVPLVIRRAGRDNPDTKVHYSMSQWYPKICVYDKNGWNPQPYVGREFYGNFGDFNVNITIDRNYILGGTGYLTNPQQIGYGYELPGTKVIRSAGDKLTWRFFAPNVHDFMWAADPEFVHQSKKIRKDLTIHLLYKTTGKYPADKWEEIMVNAEKVFPFIENKFGVYPYKQFSFIAGGDGGMEYPMATLLAGPGAWLHELMHNWYYGILASNENRYSWMDEGFTSYADNLAKAFLTNKLDSVQTPEYTGYFNVVKSGFEEPLNTPSNFFNTNLAYGMASYSKGAIFLEQLGYIVGAAVRNLILLEYYRKWSFRHPTPDDFIRAAEKVSGSKLDWYQYYWTESTRTIDYAIDSLWEENNTTKIRLRNDGLMPMPIDFQLTFKDGSKEMHYIPLDLMFHTKPTENKDGVRKVYAPWFWTSRTYTIETSQKLMDICIAEIDPSRRMADVERRNNRIELKYWEMNSIILKN
jgi:hypothetical protein